MKTRELSGAALDWAVAKCEQFDNGDWLPDYSTDWAHGGPIIERECISISYDAWKDPWAAWSESPIRDEAEAFGYGETPLTAAMRCYVASKLGDAVEIPEGLSC